MNDGGISNLLCIILSMPMKCHLFNSFHSLMTFFLMDFLCLMCGYINVLMYSVHVCKYCFSKLQSKFILS